MNKHIRFHSMGWLVAGSLLLTSGCTSLSESARTASKGIRDATAPVRKSLRLATDSKPPAPTTDWNWHAGIPLDTPRGDVLSPTVPLDAIAHLLPNIQQRQIRLASTAPYAAGGFEIRNIGGQAVSNCGELHNVIEQLPRSAADVQVDLAPIGGASHDEVAVKVDQPTLLALSHATAQQTTAFRVSEGGNQAFVIRDGGLRVQVLIRVERSLGLAQVVMTTMNCWGPATMLPVEVTTSCEGEPLQCLTVADSLELLYGDPAAHPVNGTSSFAETSEREDYLLPFNYERLAENFDSRGITSPRPALASLPGANYPGHALLADARALTGIMLQRKLLKRGERADTAWLIFAGAPARTAEKIDVGMDLGNGLKTYRFMIPTSK